jgi:hypothetical protein
VRRIEALTPRAGSPVHSPARSLHSAEAAVQSAEVSVHVTDETMQSAKLLVHSAGPLAHSAETTVDPDEASGVLFEPLVHAVLAPAWWAEPPFSCAELLSRAAVVPVQHAEPTARSAETRMRSAAAPVQSDRPAVRWALARGRSAEASTRPDESLVPSARVLVHPAVSPLGQRRPWSGRWKHRSIERGRRCTRSSLWSELRWRCATRLR